MAPREQSQLKRPRVSPHLCLASWWPFLNTPFKASPGSPQADADSKKPRRSDRLSDHDKTPVSHKQHLPSPVTHVTNAESDELYKEGTATPPEGRPSQVQKDESQANALSSPPQDTQAFSQFPGEVKDSLSEEVEDEVKEGVWGYLFPLDTKYGRPLVMKKRSACPMPDALESMSSDSDKKGKSPLKKEEQAYERTKIKGIPSGGYLIGRHPECGMYPRAPRSPLPPRSRPSC
jgi:serine/threonine-protein kinase Chk2